MDTLRLITTAMLAMLLIGSTTARAEDATDNVGDGEAQPFSVETDWQESRIGDALVILTMHLDNAPGDAYELFVQDIGYWWSSSYTMGGPTTQVFMLEAFTGGRLYEVYEAGEVQWAEVIQLEPGSFIGLGIPEGTFWSGAGSISITFAEAADGGTDLQLLHRCFQQYSTEYDGAAGYADAWSMLVGNNFRRYCMGEVIEDAVIRPEADYPDMEDQS